MRSRDIYALDEQEIAVASTGQIAGAKGASDYEGLARDIHLLSIAVGLMADLYEQLQNFRDEDAALDRDLTVEEHLISAQLVEAKDVVRQLTGAANGAKDAELMSRARVILGPLGRKLDRLAGYMDRRNALRSDTLSVDGDFFGEWHSLRSH
jgi:hypothetical protein